MKIQVVQRASDQLYWVRGCDCPDSWVRDPLHASRVGGYVYLRDAVDGLVYPPERMAGLGYEIVEFEITAAPTGRKTTDLYIDGQAISEWERDQCRAGLHSWVDDPSITDPEAQCTRKGCEETYGYDAR